MAVLLRIEGRSAYAEVHALQQELVARRAAGEIPDVVLLLEHEHAFTVGRAKGAEANVLDAGDIPVVRVERGGDVTWHGPGQLVAYPVVQLVGARADLHRHLRALEEAVFDLLADLGLPGGRDPRNTGVWLPMPDGEVRKVCSVGIACRRWVSWHGLALNVDVDLAIFQRIRPCGFDAGVMTHLGEHLSPDHPSVDALAPALAVHLARRLDVPLERFDRVARPSAVLAALGA